MTLVQFYTKQNFYNHILRT